MIDYLGDVIRPGKLDLADYSTGAVFGLKPLHNEIKLKSFLDLPKVYQRFVSNFGGRAVSLNKIHTNGKTRMYDTLSPEEHDALAPLQNKLVSTAVLALPREK